MRWPWVSRATLNDLDTHWHGMYSALALEKAALLDKYHALKLQGASMATVPPTMAPRSGDPVLAQILAASGTDRLLRGAMLREATRLRDANFSDQQIIERIQEGTPSLEGLPA